MAKTKGAPVVGSDGETMSEKEVELMLEQRDKERSVALEPVPLAPLPDTDIEAALLANRDEHIASFCAADLPHALDLAPIGSKVVVVLDDNKSVAILAGPEGADPLPTDDIAHRLPEGARISKIAPDRYEAVQLGATVVQPLLVTAKARDAIAAFIGHFHGRDS